MTPMTRPGTGNFGYHLRRPALFTILSLLLGSTALSAASNDASDLIDSQISKSWQEHEVTPAPVSSDSEFLRRAYLDIAGVVPPIDEARGFLRSQSSNKRADLIDRLLNSALYADHIANVWEVLLIGRGMKQRGVSPTPLRDWMRNDIFAQNVPFDRFARELVAGQGGASVFFASHDAPNKVVASLTRTFLGVRMNCSECHDDKRGQWKQSDFWSLAAFFSPSRQINYERRTKTGEKETVEQLIASARFLPGTKAVSDGGSSRDQFGRWLTSRENPWFAKEIVNRVWSHFFGRGLADPVDDFWSGMQPMHPELLDVLSREFVSHNYDLKWLIRSVVSTRAYQLSSRTGKKETDDPLNLYFTRAEFRPLTPEQMYYSMVQAIESRGSDNRRGEALLASKDQYLQRFITLFANDDNQEEKHFEGSVAQTLFLFNGDFVNQTVQTEARTGLGSIFRSAGSDNERVRQLFLRTLSREPNEKEMDVFKKYLSGSFTRALMAQGPKIITQTILRRSIDQAIVRSGVLNGVGGSVAGTVLSSVLRGRSRSPEAAAIEAIQGASKTREQLFEDLYWALLNSTEFIYNH